MTCVDRFSTCHQTPKTLNLMPPDPNWSKHTCRETVQCLCKPPFCLPQPSMEGDSVMNGWDWSTQEQIKETFQFLAPIFDRSLNLQPNPRAQKARKTNMQDGQEDHVQPGIDPRQLQQYLLALGQLVLRHDHSLSTLQSTDSFILFSSRTRRDHSRGSYRRHRNGK